MQATDNFRVNMRTAIEARGISQTDFAKTNGVSRGFFNRVLAGTQEPSLSFADKLGSALGFHIWEITLPPITFSGKFFPKPRKAS